MNPRTEGNGRGGCTVVAVASSFFTTPPHSSTTTEEICGGGLGCNDDDECSSVVGDIDQAPILNPVRLGPKRIR